MVFMDPSIILEPQRVMEYEEYTETLIVDTTSTLVYWSVDNAGNIEETKNFTILIDKEEPITGNISAFMEVMVDDIETIVEYEFGTWTPNQVYIKFKACEDNIGCDTYWLVNGEEYPGSRRCKYDIVIGDAGIYTITYWAVDWAGNIGEIKSEILRIAEQSPYGTGIGDGYWEFPDDATPDNAEWLRLHDDLEININDSEGRVSSIILPAGTTMTKADGGNLDLSELSAGEVLEGVISGLESWRNQRGVIQFGMPSIGLRFSKPITIKIFVGEDLNGQTLNILRSVSGNSGWTNEGIVSPTCTVVLGYCEFETTLASYFVTTSGSAPRPSSGGSGGGGSGTITVCNTQWSCSDWNECIGGEQTRICSYPEGVCAPTSEKPTEAQLCIAEIEEIYEEEIIETIEEEIQEDERVMSSSGITGAVIGGVTENKGIVAIIIIGAVIALAGGISFLSLKKKK